MGDAGGGVAGIGPKGFGPHRSHALQQGATTAMTKSELILRLSERNPHLYQRDIEKIVGTIFDQITEALARAVSEMSAPRAAVPAAAGRTGSA